MKPFQLKGIISESAMKKILVSNDDGIHAEGLKVLAKALESVGEVYVVAPDRERSAASHSLTLHRPLRVTRISERAYAVDGTPTDCINLAVNGILHFTPDLVVSGINRGGNLGDDITYSGTVSAAMEGTLLGIPSFAVSLVVDYEEECDFTEAAGFAVRLASYVLERGLPRDTLLNVNVPNRGDIKGYRITKQGKRIYGEAVVEKVDPRGKKYYWIGANSTRWHDDEDTDFKAIDEGFISVTPIHLDLTNYASLEELKRSLIL